VIPNDAIELLLPDADPERMDRARRVTTFLRLLASDAGSESTGPASAGSVRVSLERARQELELDTHRRIGAALSALLRHHLTEALGPDSFCSFGPPGLRPRTAWSQLEEVREERPGLPGVPEPGESALSVAVRLLESCRRLEVLGPDLALFEAHLCRALEGPRRGEAAFRRLLDASGDAPPAVWVGLIECTLDRGAVAAAAALLEESAVAVPQDRASGMAAGERLVRLRSWVRLLRDAPPGPSGVGAEAGTETSGGPIPVPLVELRERRPDWRAWLVGRPASARAARPETPRTASRSREHAGDRTDFGASVLGVFALQSDGSQVAVHLDVAPALQKQREDWLRERDGACTAPGELEQSIVARPEWAVRHRRAAEPLSGVLCEDALAVVLAPVLDDQGEVAGWLRLELEHHLVPSRARLELAAGAWRAAVLEARGRSLGCERPGPGMSACSEASAPRAGVGASDPRAAVLRELVEGLGIKTGQRGWWGFAVEGDRLERITGGGSLGPDSPDSPDSQRSPRSPRSPARVPADAPVLTRAVRSGSFVRYGSEDARGAHVALHPSTQSGLVVPLLGQGRVVGLVCIESARRRDLGAALERRLLERADAHMDPWTIARFRAWHVEHYGFDVHFEARHEVGADLLRDVLTAGRARAPVVVAGPPGSGKQVLARWIHFEGPRGGPLQLVSCRFRPADRALFEPGTLERAHQGTILLDGLDRLPRRHQRELIEHLSQCESQGSAPSSGTPRFLATMQAAPAEVFAAGRLLPDLARWFQRLHVVVPPLAERRDEFPGLVAVLLERFSKEEGVHAPRLDDPTLAMLWRQPWEGQVRELENLLYKLVVQHGGEDVHATQLERLARRLGFEWVRRASSREPDAELIRCALRSTRTGRGTLNKTRAALYLGWDPDTLVTRMKELGIDPSTLVDDPCARVSIVRNKTRRGSR
jgi:hypothetical protein